MTSVSTLLHLLCLLSASLLCGATEYYVRPTEPTNTLCPGQPCLTFSQYTSDSGFQWSNAVLRFLSGTHQVNASIMIENAHNVILMAEDKYEESQVLVYSQNMDSSKPNDMLLFKRLRNITIDSLSFVLHPQDGVKFIELRLHFKQIIGLHLKNSKIRSTNRCWPCSIAVRNSHCVRISNLTIYYGGAYFFYTRNIHISTVTSAYIQCFNMSTSQSAYIGIILDHTNNTIMQSIVLMPNDAQRIGMGMGVKVTGSYNVTVADTTLSSSINPFPPFLNTADIVRQPAVIELHESNVTVRNCTFSNNNISALKLVRTHLKVFGNLTFTGNRAYKGAAMIFIESYIILTETCYITFTDNFADDAGGAIYIVPERVYLRPPYALKRSLSLLNSVKLVSTTTKCFLH